VHAPQIAITPHAAQQHGGYSLPHTGHHSNGYGQPPAQTNGSGDGDDPMAAIAKQLRRLFSEQGNGNHFDNLESLIVHEAFAHVRSNQVHASALLGISRNVMRTLLKRHGLLADNGYKQDESTPFDQDSPLTSLDASLAR
jgi:DNA-binding NtrC family response regulator